MTQDETALYNAYASRDPRFDGVFFIGVTSTGIYCRPVCTARTPKAANCRFFRSAAAAEVASFRPCLRCRPELAPGSAPVDSANRTATRIAQRISAGMLDTGAGLEAIAAEFHVSSRQLRRIVREELGVSPIELVLSRRLLLAKQLLTETTLPIIQVAYSSGFSSLRRFNDAFRGRYGMPPTRLRGAAGGLDAASAAEDTLTLQLVYRPPYDWAGVIAFLRARAAAGVEAVSEDGCYHRTVRIGEHRGWIRVEHFPLGTALRVEIGRSLTPVLPMLLARVRNLFDLTARPDLIAAHLGGDTSLSGVAAWNPGLRVAGAFDGFELAVRAVLGQQITVKGATAMAGRFVEGFGDLIITPHPSLTHHFPRVERIAGVDEGAVASLGIIRTRARCIIALAQEISSGRLVLEPGADHEDTVRRLIEIPGIGAWTAQYVAMRALRWPDAFPKEDVVVRKRLGGVTASEAERISRKWRPWRSYATVHLWAGAGASAEKSGPDNRNT